MIGKAVGALAAVVGVALGTTGAAAEGWTLFPEDSRTQGAEICNAADGEFLCFQLRCREGKPLELALESSPGWPLSEGAADITLMVDRADPEAYTFARTDENRPNELALPFHPVQHADLVQQLRRGKRLTAWILPLGGEATGVGFSLSGSSAALNALLDGRCATIARQDPRLPEADPVVAGHKAVGVLPAAAPLGPAGQANEAGPAVPETPPAPAADVGAPAEEAAPPAPPAGEEGDGIAGLPAVALSTKDETSLELARAIMGPIIEAVTSLEGKAPELAAQRIDLKDDRALLFTRLCGGAYFGPTGCSGVVFTLSGESASPIFGDGDLFTSKSLAVKENSIREGWPDLLVEGGEAWGWSGGGYRRLP